MYDFAVCKLCSQPLGRPRYRIREGTICVCSGCGFHYLDHLDEPVETPAEDSGRLTAEDVEYIERGLESNRQRLEHQVSLVGKYCSFSGVKCLDIGCGSGLFLHLLSKEGVDVHGLEVAAKRIRYARDRYGLRIDPYPAEDAFWQDHHGASFDAVCLWDVIEHVNFPEEVLTSAVNLLKPHGYLFLDTPARDAFYHRVGVVTYRLSAGKCPTFLNGLYSNQPFAHKQIFASKELSGLVSSLGMEVVELRKIHELSFPLNHYLKRLLPWNRVAALAEPLAKCMFAVWRIRNKTVLVARKLR